jgi:ABC-type transport system involved in multi-copper enzyme maturation permease subunit
MDAFWNFLKEFGKWFGLLFILLAFFGGLINGIVMMTYQFWAGFYWMLQTWVFGVWLGLVIIMLGMVVDNTRGA